MSVRHPPACLCFQKDKTSSRPFILVSPKGAVCYRRLLKEISSEKRVSVKISPTVMAKCERDPDDQLLSYSIIEVPFKSSSSYPLKGEITDICTQHYNMFILYRIIQPIFHKNINKW